MMMRFLSLLALVALLTTPAGAEPAATPPAAVEQEIRQVIRERLDAYARADAAGWSRFVADDCLCGVATKAALQQEIQARPSSVRNWHGEIAELQVHGYAETAVARYRITEYTELGGHRIGVELWRTETYLRRAGRWMLVAGSDSVIPQDPVAAKVDPKLYDAYVGQYQYAPGTVDTVTREGDRLMVQATGQAKEELFPENETTFFGKGQDWRMIFVKDGQGRVTAVHFRQHQQDLVGTKIK
jgi:ketosteroid isomerase-like protein